MGCYFLFGRQVGCPQDATLITSAKPLPLDGDCGGNYQLSIIKFEVEHQDGNQQRHLKASFKRDNAAA